MWPYSSGEELEGSRKTWKQHGWLKEQAAAAKYIMNQSSVPGQGVEDEV